MQPPFKGIFARESTLGCAEASALSHAIGRKLAKRSPAKLAFDNFP
jgi:hypothetical protein